MYSAKEIESKLAKIDYNFYSRPSEALLDEVFRDGKSRVLASGNTTRLCKLSDTYFDFCWAQVAQFCVSSYNAVEIAFMVGIQPIYVAAYINRYGSDWSVKLFQRKGISEICRDEHSVVQTKDLFWSVYAIQQRLVPRTSLVTEAQKRMHGLLCQKRYSEFQAAASHTHTMLISLVTTDRQAIFNDPRVNKKTKAEEKQSDPDLVRIRPVVIPAQSDRPAFNAHLRQY